MSIGKKIQYYRKRKEITQKELAETLNIAIGTIQQYELDKREPKFDMICKLASALDTPAYTLYDFDEPDTTEEQFRNACQWLEDADISIDPPNENDGLQQYYLSKWNNNGDNLEISCKLDKIDIIHLVDECVNEANEIRNEIAIKNIKRELKNHSQ